MHKIVENATCNVKFRFYCILKKMVLQFGGWARGLAVPPHKISACEMLQRASIVFIMQATSISYPLELLGGNNSQCLW